MPVVDGQGMKKKIEECIVPYCNREVEVKSHRLCHAHYLRYVRHGTVGNTPIRPKRPNRKLYDPAEDPVITELYALGKVPT